MDNKLVERIRKLLALANSPNEAEAKLAAEKANELLTRHNITLSQLKEEETEYQNETIMIKKMMPFEVRWVMLLMKYYFVEAIFTSGSRWKDSKRRAKVFLIGTPTNVEIAKYIFDFLVPKYKMLWKGYQQEAGLPHSLKGEYYRGLTMGIAAQLEAKQESVAEEMGALVPVDPNLPKQVSKFHGKLKSSSLEPMEEDSSVLYDSFLMGKSLHIAPAIGTEKKDSETLALPDNS